MSYWYNAKSDEWASFAELYKAKYGSEPTTHAAQGYQATMIVLDALERAGTDDGPALREALERTSLENHLLPQAGPVTFAEDGQNKAIASPLTQLVDGEAKIIWPPEFREADAVFPDPLATYAIGSE